MRHAAWRLLCALSLFASLPSAASSAGRAEPGRDARAAEVDVAVVGAGPAGLAAAIEAKLQGAESVVVFEKRDAFTRPQNLGLFRNTLDNLARWGAPIELGDEATVIQGQRLRMRRIVRAERAGDDVDDLRTDQVSVFIPARVLQRKLTEAARALGVDVRFGEEVSRLRVNDDGVLVKTADGAVAARYAVVADGAGGRLSSRLGLKPFAATPGKTRFLNAIFVARGNGLIRDVTDNLGTVVRQGGPNETALVEVPRRLDLSDPIARRTFYLSRTPLVGLAGELISEPQEFLVRLRGLLKHGAQRRAFVIGDAARTTHPFTGQGVNLALRDAMRVGGLIGALMLESTSRERDKLVARFERQMARASRLTHAYAKRAFPFKR